MLITSPHFLIFTSVLVTLSAGGFRVKARASRYSVNATSNSRLLPLNNSVEFFFWQRLIKMHCYDERLYENVDDLMFETGTLLSG